MTRSVLALLVLTALPSGCDDRRAEAAVAASARPPIAALSASGAPAPPPPKPTAPPRAVRYPSDRVESPISAAVVQSMRRIAARNPSLPSDAFAKIGDSITASADYLYCFSKHHRLHHVDLADHGELASTLERFRGGKAAGRDPFFRESVAAVVGWSAWQMLRGTPSPLDVELDKVPARFAFVMFGTNDLEAQNPRGYADNMFDVVDHIIQRGTIPIVFSIPPRLDKPSRNAWVPRYNGVVRGIAMLRQIPFVDFHLALDKAPHHGLAKWGIHPSTYAGKLGFDACDFSAEGLEHGYNVRNLVSLEALDRASRALERNAPLDPPSTALAGEGTARDPLRVGTLPFVDTPDPAARKTTLYRLDVAGKRGVHVLAVAHGGAPPTVDVARRDKPDAPLASGNGSLVAELEAGSYLVRIAPRAPDRDVVVVISDEPHWAE